MIFRVELGARAQADLDEAFRFTSRNAPLTARDWLHRFEIALSTLAENPSRCGLAPESKRLNRELRQLLFGRRQFKYRAVYFIEGDLVHIVRIRRAAMRGMSRRDLDESP
jgi:plasmid stabilization system protein ParE